MLQPAQYKISFLVTMLVSSITISASANSPTTWQAQMADESRQLSHTIDTEAHQSFSGLKTHPFFAPSVMRNARALKTLLQENYTVSEHTITVPADEQQEAQEVQVTCTFVDRGADKLLVIAPGFTNPNQLMAPMVPMFPDYDLVLMEFRGHGLLKEGSWLDPRTWHLNPVRKQFGVDLRVTGLGSKEHLDLIAVVQHFKHQKAYTQTLGYGLCFGAFVMLKATALQPGLFDKLIVDSSWTSLDKFIEKIRNRPGLIINPQDDMQVPTCGLENATFFDYGARLLSLFGLWFPENVDLLHHIHAITETPVLLFHGTKDLTITDQEFQTLFKALPTPDKIAIITPNPHVRNHLYEKEKYAYVCNAFYQRPLKEFRRFVAP